MLLIPLVERRIWGLCLCGHGSFFSSCSLSPTTFSAASLASFYGNDLQCSMALQLVRVCHYDATDKMLHQIQSLYDGWSNSPTVHHLGIYWNMRHRKFVWPNGSYGPQLEFLESPGDNNATITGFVIKPHAWILRRRLHYLRRTVHC